MVETAYRAGLTGLDSKQATFFNDTQRLAFEAGKEDKRVQDRLKLAQAQKTTVYETGFTENEHSAKLTPAEREMFSTMAKDFKMDAGFVDKIVAFYVNGKPREANASHLNGKMEVSSTSQRPMVAIALHEGGHRMRELDPQSFDALMTFLYETSEQNTRRMSLGDKGVSLFDRVKAEYDGSNQSMNATDYIEEIAARRLETILTSAEAYNKWRSELDLNPQAKSAWQKFVEIIKEILEDMWATITNSKMSLEAKRQAQKELELFADAYRGAMKAAQTRANEVQSKNDSTNSVENLEIMTNEDYNGNIRHSLKDTTEDDTKGDSTLDIDDVLDKSDYIGYVPITKVKMKTFPPYNKSKSDANEWATRWAHREDVETGAQTLVFYHNRCYVIGKYDSAYLKYQIDGRISYKAYESIRKELEEDARNREKQSQKKMVDFLRERNERGNSDEGRGQSLDYSSVEHGREDRDVLRLGGKQDGERGIQIDISRSDEYDSEDRKAQSLNERKNYSLKGSEGYNENIRYSLKWRTDLNQSQFKQVEKLIRQAGNPETTRITDTANWYKGRINGEDLFVIYSTEDTNNPTILYEVKGRNANFERDILLNLLEEIENGESIDGKSAYVNWVSGSGWLQKVNHSQNNLRNLGSGQNHQNAGVLPSQSKRNGSPAFWSVVENLFKRQEQDGSVNNRNFSLKDSDSDTLNNNIGYSSKDLYKELFEVPREVEEKLSNQIDAWVQGDLSSNEVFDLGKTPTVLKELGVKELPMVMAQDVLAKINGVRHDVSLENIRNLPKNIADPIMIFKSATVPNAFVILTEMEDMSGRPIVAALHLNKTEKHIRVNRIASVYGRNGVNAFVKEQFAKGNVKYIDKIKSQNWSQSRGLQLPKLADTNPDNNIILYKEDIVNTYNMQNNNELLSNKKPSTNSDINFSLKNSVDVSPKKTTEYLDTVEDVQKGKKGASERLAKYVDSGIISTEFYDELIEKYGAIPSGEKPHRDIQVPQKTAKDKKVSQTVRTILEAKATPDEAVPTIEKMVEDGIFSYDAYTDKQAIEDAKSYIKEYGWDESLDDWFDSVNKGEVSKELTTMGWALYNNAANIAATTTSETERTTAIKTSLKILDAMVRHQRSAAQALQATRILKSLSPETQLYGVQKSVNALQNELSEKYGDKAPDLKIDEDLAKKFLTAETEDERLAAEIEIYKDIGRQMPSDWLDMWNAWRYVAMLTNLLTHGRNILGNAGFAPVVFTKDLTATAIEAIVQPIVRKSGKNMVRSKALVWGSKSDRALLKAAWNDYSNVADMVSNGGKYNDSAMGNKYIQEGRTIFRGVLKPVEVVRKTNSKLLELEDVWFSKPHYAYALAQYCKANNITAEQIIRGKAIAPARDYAIKEAQKATYKDTNAFSQLISEFGRNGKNKDKAHKALGVVTEGALPFRKTPANSLVRGVEYSPLGLLKGLNDIRKVGKKVDGRVITATEVIDNISAGLTGTGLLALGIYLAAQGLVRGQGEGDKDEKEFEELMGHQSYSLELPNGESITLDWLAPESLPFFTGVRIWEKAKGEKEDISLSVIQEAINGISDPMLEMSFIQGLNDVFESVGYAKSNDTNAIYSILQSALTSYITQALPTLFGQIERTGEEYRMTTYTEKDNFLTSDVQRTLGKASAKIPFWDYNQIPYIDAWGRKEASGVALKRGLNNFLNPAYTSTIETSDMEEELLRLYEETGEGGVFPERADKYFTVDGERKDLTADEYVRYATLKGEKSYKLVSDLVNSSAYKKLSDQEKVKAIKETYDYANQKAKETISNYKPEAWVKKADEFSNVGNYISFKTEVNGTKENNDGKISKQEVVDIILDMAQNDSETWKMYLSMYDGDKDRYAYDKGIDGETYMNFLELLNDVDEPTKSGKYGTYTQEEAKRAVQQLDGLSQEEKATLYQSVNTTWKKNPFR